NNWLTSVSTNSDSSIVEGSKIENSLVRCNHCGYELNSLVRQREKGYLTARIERLTHRRNRYIPDPKNKAVETAVNYWEVHQINNIVFGCYLRQQKIAPAPQANDRKLVQMSQSAKSPTFTAQRRNSGALTAPLKIKFFAVLSQKIYLGASPFLSGGGVSKHQ
ncbi:MAG: hypothetical protein ICV80_24415, partial [Microcoleus sp. T1-bin1]|nr:hypothetical protein [Microcoleus sp. T1-bin1]